MADENEERLAIERVRVICRDAQGRVLLMKWRDPVNGREFWEPPGGGIEPGESTWEAATRELYEETGLTDPIANVSIIVAREYDWLGDHYRHAEAFFTVSTTSTNVALVRPTQEEIGTFREMRFILPEEMAKLTEPVEPPNLIQLLTTIESQ